MALSGKDASQTELAVERTMLAWWRTALAAIAVALAVGRLLPELAPDAKQWPLVTLGLGFSAYAIGVVIYGTIRHAPSKIPIPLLLIAALSVVLGLATAALIALS